ncbi:hypothetical protein BU24DRAFT_423034 [Aaosphaeria arxii CBS 175.79]|uniref:Uncharacterized protein n=1 Tax=Aaosphaeria arxii CBS 175.79 TaxID=1450172 RepID=A0A6A5XTI3_9PLEO|nr:uncharacterized protein BU24DRAFT_423034 [Aaosphaeria arxii CBS 175.79]KAF2016655.1 hypothetical protein BU24DRAFT_423034 [Aaosphaeria arxii CBS 175.79]
MGFPFHRYTVPPPPPLLMLLSLLPCIAFSSQSYEYWESVVIHPLGIQSPHDLEWHADPWFPNAVVIHTLVYFI